MTMPLMSIFPRWQQEEQSRDIGDLRAEDLFSPSRLGTVLTGLPAESPGPGGRGNKSVQSYTTLPQ